MSNISHHNKVGLVHVDDSEDGSSIEDIYKKETAKQLISKSMNALRDVGSSLLKILVLSAATFASASTIDLLSNYPIHSLTFLLILSYLALRSSHLVEDLLRQQEYSIKTITQTSLGGFNVLRKEKKIYTFILVMLECFQYIIYMLIGKLIHDNSTHFMKPFLHAGLNQLFSEWCFVTLVVLGVSSIKVFVLD